MSVLSERLSAARGRSASLPGPTPWMSLGHARLDHPKMSVDIRGELSPASRHQRPVVHTDACAARDLEDICGGAYARRNHSALRAATDAWGHRRSRACSARPSRAGWPAIRTEVNRHRRFALRSRDGGERGDPGAPAPPEEVALSAAKRQCPSAAKRPSCGGRIKVMTQGRRVTRSGRQRVHQRVAPFTDDHVACPS